MLENGQYKLKTLSKIKEISPDTDLLVIKFAGYLDQEVYCFNDYNEIAGYLDKDVVVEFREEYIDGAIRLVANNITVINRVTVLDREENLKLFTDADLELGCNVIFTNIPDGAHLEKAILFCKTAVRESSERASWVKLTVLDKLRRVSYLRVFDAEGDLSVFQGCYIKCSLRKTKYGLVAEDVFIQSEANIADNPKVTIAETYLKNVVAKDILLSEFVQKYDLITKIREYMYEEGEEVGMLLVRTAMEVAYINESKNISQDLDTEALIRLAFASKGYATVNEESPTYSKNMINIIRVASHPIGRDKKLLVLLDEGETKTKYIEKVFFEQISSMSKSLVQVNGPLELKSIQGGF